MKRMNLCLLLSIFVVTEGINGCDNSSGEATQTSCKADESKCVSEDQFKTCNTEGQWGNPVTCPNATPVCDSEKNTCVEGTVTSTCTDGARRCDGENKIQTCNGGSWGQSETCPGNTPHCDSNQNKCVSTGNPPATLTCVNGRTKCTDNKHMKTCTDDSWGTPVECPEETPVCVESFRECVECTPNDKRCINEEQYQICRDNGTWGSAVTCPAPTGICSDAQNDCVEGTPTTTCTDGDTRCNGNNNIETCNGGVWTTTACPNDKPFCDSSINQCVVCIPGVDICEVQSSGKYALVYHCTENRKKDPVMDGNGYCGQQLCNEAGTACKCTDGIRTCYNQDEVRVCRNGNWETEHSCADNEICYNHLGSVCVPDKTEICNEGETICNDEVLYECKDGLFVGVTQEDDCDESGCDLVRYFCITTNITKGSRHAYYSKEECINASFCNKNKQWSCDSQGKWTSEDCPSTTGSSPHCIVDGTPSESGAPLTGTKCIDSKNNFVLTCEGDDLYFNVNDTERTKLVNCNDYGLKCISGKYGISIPGYFGSGGCVKK